MRGVVKNQVLYSLVSVAFLIPSANGAAQSSGKQWEFILAPYFLAPHMNGNTVVGGVSSEVDVSPADIFRQLQFGAMLYFEARSPVWAVAVDGLYMNLSEEVDLPPGDVIVDQGMIEFTIMRRVGPWAEVLAGGRLNVIGMGFQGSGPLGVDVDSDQTWLDPFVGVRLTGAPNDKVTLTLRGDIGGFGIGSDIAWQLYPVFGYRLTRVVGLSLGYRALSMDYETNAGAFVYDVTTFGPELGLVFHF